MKIEIIAIGDELLSGQTVNTNAALIGKKLFSKGLKVGKVTALPDEYNALREGIKEAMGRSDFIITTGGLGPTGDDITRDVIADIFEQPLVQDSEVKKDLINRFGKKLVTLENQSMVIKEMKVIRNSIGTAPGFICGSHPSIYVLPGVPIQMEEMLEDAIEDIQSKCSEKFYIKNLYLALLTEKQVDPLLRELEQKLPGISIGICPGYGVLSIYFQGKDQHVLDRAFDEVVNQFETHVFSKKSKKIEEALQDLMINKRFTLSIAESCTGGWVSSRITQVPYCSQYYLGGVVSYSNLLKESVLKVPHKVLETHGAVSEEAVISMASGVKKVSGADFSIAISGIAGPNGGSKEKPIGTIYSAISTPEGVFSGKIPFKGSIKKRSLYIDYSATYLLSALYRYIVYGVCPYGL